jgi:drug/metabolite transporter (DMT)-like permease
MVTGQVPLAERAPALWPVLALSLCSALWGSTFFMSKDLVGRYDPMTLLALRFGIAALVMWVIRPGCLRGLSKRLWFNAVVLGVIYGAAQIPHFYGLRFTSASTAGFVIGTYVVLTPALAFLLLGVRSSLRVYVGVALAIIGLGVLSLQGWSFGLGESLALLAALLYALQIVTMGVWSLPGEAWALTTIQMGALFVVLSIPSLLVGVDLPSSGVDWLVIAYLAIFAGALALGVQTWAQSRLSPTYAAVIMAAQPLWSAGLAVLLTSETLTPRLLVGGTVLLAANAVILINPRRAPEGHSEAPAHRVSSPLSGEG